LASNNLSFAFLKAKAELIKVRIQRMKPDMIGDAARVQG
jgi:hypothetical protein